MSACPYCHTEQDGHQPVNVPDEAVPQPGNVTVCSSCVQVSVFAVGPLGVFRRKPTRGERAQIDASPEVQIMLAGLASRRRT